MKINDNNIYDFVFEFSPELPLKNIINFRYTLIDICIDYPQIQNMTETTYNEFKCIHITT